MPGATKHRYKQVALNNGVTETTIYTGGLEIVTKGSGATEYRHTVTAYGKSVLLDTFTNDPTTGNPVEGRHFLLGDHLGSVDRVVDSTGNLVPQESFDSFGQRRDPTTWMAPLSSGGVSTDRTVTHRGYTGHEELDNVGLVHMEGRVYDPVLGRFMSADPKVQDLYNSQTLNRYAYVDNNPLNSTDPTGFADIGNNSTPIIVPLYAGPLPLNYIVESAAMTAPGNYGAGNNSLAFSSVMNPTGNPFAVDFADPTSLSAHIADEAQTDTVAVWHYLNDPYAKPLLQEGATELAQYMADKSTQTDSKIAAVGYDVIGVLATRFDYDHAAASLNLLAAVFGGIKVSAENGEGAPSLNDLFKGGATPKASEIAKWAEGQGWNRTQSSNGPVKYVDENGIPRITLKQGSSRAPGSGNPHVEIRNESGQRVNPSGDPVSRHSPENHTPINYDLPP